MIVPSPQFLVFAAVVALIINIRGTLRFRQTVLLAANLLFLASFSNNPVAFAPFAGFLALGYAAQRATRGGSMPRLFVALLLLTIAVFFWLKRYTFIPTAVFLPLPYVLVGLSYVFFRVLHLIIDSHQGDVKNEVGLVSYLNYTLNFTSLTSGPIQRYQDYRRSETDPPPLTWIDAGRALERSVVGYFKVAIVSFALSEWQHEAISTLAADPVPSGIIVAGIYPLYLFCNFSGYTDVVIGVARFLRIELPENFDRPFAAENFLQFWSRWHITLSNWLKTYVYNPLMMTLMVRITRPKAAPYLAVIAFFVTFFLVGLWHGQTSEFLFFGFLQGGGVAANKLYQVLMAEWMGRSGYRTLCANPIYAAGARGLTYTWFAFTLFWFWSDWGQIGNFVTEIGATATVFVWLSIFAIATVTLAAVKQARYWISQITWSVDPGTREPVFQSRYVRTAVSTFLVIATVVIIGLLGSPAPDVVYKTF